MREMGKAMMGTGEASGDKRAILAAEAAIANPLLDEVSMKGARGLLISITGGNDLTLYEVDEAASRIRQEVDEDANIILGATFDSNLDGIVRVSVVATGIDQPLGSKEISANEARIAEVTQKLRAQANARPAEVHTRPVMQSEPAAPAYDAAPAAASPQQNFAPAQTSYAAAPAAYAQPVAPQATADVEIMPVASKSASFTTPVPAPAPARPDFQDQGPFIPPAPAQTPRTQRMPQIEDLPLPVQNQIRVQRGEPAADQQTDTKRRTLLERLASFGMSRQEEAAAVPVRSAPQAPMPQPRIQAPAAGGQYAQPQPQGQAPRLPQPNSAQAEYGKRPMRRRRAGTRRHRWTSMAARCPPRAPSRTTSSKSRPFLRRQSN